MKKIILLLSVIMLIVSLSVVGFMGCQGKTSLTQIFQEYDIFGEAKFPETFTYDMFEGESTTSIGTLTMTVEKLTTSTTYYLGKDGMSDEANAIYAVTSAPANATYKATTTLALADGSYSQTNIAIFANNYKLLGSYSKTVKGDKTTAYVSYVEDGKKYKFRTNADWDNEESIKTGKYASSPYFDNTMVYYVARNMPNMSEYASFSFNIFNHDTVDKESVALTNYVVNDVEDAYLINYKENGETKSTACRKITMKTSDALLGVTNSVECYISCEKIGSSKQVITKIIEGNYNYVLTK